MHLKTSLISALAAASLAVGCGKKDPTLPTTVPTATTATTAATTAPPTTAATTTAATTAPPTTTAATTTTAPTAGAPDAAAPSNGLSTTAPADVAQPPADATKTASGLAYKTLVEGAGPDKPHDYDTVTVYYVGWTTDGKMFDSAVPPSEPISFPLNRVIAGWTEGVQLMKLGDRTRFWIPENLAYQGQPGAPAGMLVFDVELVKITAGKKPMPAPEDVAAAPADAQKTPSGLAWKVLQPGQAGGAKPTAASTVTVHYTGWTTDGKMFDSSVMRGQPATFPLGQVIAGWTEGLQLMTVGEKSRFWIPVDLAYKGRPGRPAGMLVFDVELISFQ